MKTNKYKQAWGLLKIWAKEAHEENKMLYKNISNDICTAYLMQSKQLLDAIREIEKEAGL